MAVSTELQATRAALVGQVDAVRHDLTSQVAAARQDLLVRTERQAAALRTDVLGEVAQIRLAADRRVGDSLARVDTALAAVNALHDDLKPTLDNAALITARPKMLQRFSCAATPWRRNCSA